MRLSICLILFLFAAITPEMYSQIPDVTSGTIERHANFKSKIVNARNVDVWLPDGYSTDKKYAVLYMHDGQMLYDAAKTWNGQEWDVDGNVSKLIKENRIKDCIVVGIWNDRDNRWSDYNPQKAVETLPESVRNTSFKNKMFAPLSSDNYLKFIVTELKPFIDKKYSTLSDRENTVVMGSSMGGLISMYAICEYPDVFGGAGCLSTHWVGDPEKFNELVPQAYASYLEEHLPDPATHKIYFDFGTETLDQYYEPWQMVIDEIMEEAGYDRNSWMTKKFEGEAHTETDWAGRLHYPLEFLLGN